MPIMIIMIPTVALIALTSCSGKLCLDYLIMLKTPSMISQRPKPTRTTESAFNNLSSPQPIFVLSRAIFPK
jgi:hypothetical protein